MIRFSTVFTDDAEAHLVMNYITDSLVQIQCSGSDEASCHLTFGEGGFRGGEAGESSSVFELVPVGDYEVALRPASQEEEGDVTMAADCFLGFSNAVSEPECYTSTEYAATRFTIYH